MVLIKYNSPLFLLLQILTETGEYPYSNLGLLGNQRVLQRKIRRIVEKEPTAIVTGSAEAPPAIKMEIVDPIFQIVGSGHNRGIRLTKSGLKAMEAIDPKAAVYYTSELSGRIYSNVRHRDRNHRCAETVAMLKMAGISTLPLNNPNLQRTLGSQQLKNDVPVFYPSRHIKQLLSKDEMDKTGFTRYIGVLLGRSVCIPVYNTRNRMMKWDESGENKALYDILNIAEANTEIREIDSACVLGMPGMELQIRDMMDSSNGMPSFGPFQQYTHIHFIPLDQFGVQLLKLFKQPNWHRQFLSAVFGSSIHTEDYDSFPYDVITDTEFTLSFMDGDLNRLFRFVDAIRTGGSEQRGRRFRLLYFKEQKAVCEALTAGLDVELYSITVDRAQQVLQALGNTPR